MTLLLDDRALVAVLRGTPAVLAALRGLRDVPLTAAPAAEAVLAATRPQERAAVGALLSWLHVVPVGLAEARRGAAWRATRPDLPATVGLVAACAAERGATLATVEGPQVAVLSRLDGLRLLAWPG